LNREIDRTKTAASSFHRSSARRTKMSCACTVKLYVTSVNADAISATVVGCVA
jgi:hypothetical protein